MLKRKLEVYCDGSSFNNGRSGSTGGYGYLIVDGSEIIYKHSSPRFSQVTNSEMEIIALLESLKYIRGNIDLLENDVIIYSDSAFVVNSYNKWIYSWMKNNFKNGSIKYPDLWTEIYNLKHPSISLEWVKGHSKNIFNETADKLAKGIK